MVDLKDLRPGNMLFLYGIDYDAGGMKIIDKSEKEVLSVKSVVGGKINDEVLEEQVDGIALTPTILTAISGNNKYVPRLTFGGLFDSASMQLSLIIQYRRRQVEVRFLHQLQNIYADKFRRKLKIDNLAM